MILGRISDEALSARSCSIFLSGTFKYLIYVISPVSHLGFPKDAERLRGSF